MSGSRLFVVSVLLIGIACSSTSGDVTDPGPTHPVPPTGSVSGVVRGSPGSQPVAGAIVTVGGSNVTSDANGRYQAGSVPVGPAVDFRVAAVGFEPYADRISVLEGANTRDVSLTRTLYDDDIFTMYLDPGVSTYRGVLVYLPGSGGDTRLIVRADPLSADPFTAATIEAELPMALQLARKYGLALLGADELGDFPVSEDVHAYDRLLAALSRFATLSGHAELATAPLLLEGFSNGSCVAYGFTRLHSERVAALVLLKGGCHAPVDALGARSVPAYAFIGELDTETRRTNLTTAFEENRARGALWAFAIDRCQAHDRLRAEDVNRLYSWLDTVLALRLPPVPAPGQPVVLRSVAESIGWLGDLSSFQIAGYSAYAGDRPTASWLPAEQTARDWQTMVSRTCNSAR